MRLSDLYRFVREGKPLPKKVEPKEPPQHPLPRGMVEILAMHSDGKVESLGKIDEIDYENKLKPAVKEFEPRYFLKELLSEKGWWPSAINLDALIEEIRQQIKIDFETIDSLDQLAHNAPFPFKNLLKNMPFPVVFSNVSEAMLKGLASLKVLPVDVTRNQNLISGRFELLFTLLTQAKKAATGDLVADSAKIEVKGLGHRTNTARVTELDVSKLTPEAVIEGTSYFNTEDTLKQLRGNNHLDYLFVGRDTDFRYVFVNLVQPDPKDAEKIAFISRENEKILRVKFTTEKVQSKIAISKLSGDPKQQLLARIEAIGVENMAVYFLGNKQEVTEYLGRIYDILKTDPITKGNSEEAIKLVRLLIPTQKAVEDVKTLPVDIEHYMRFTNV